MAGIGFELKKVFMNRTIIGRIKGFTYASLISVGPMLMSVLMLIVVNQLLKRADVPILERELVNAAIMYSFIFSMINVSGLSMSIARFIADEIYRGNSDNVLASLVGVIAINLPVCGLAGILLFWRSPLPFDFKLLVYMMFIELSVLYLLMVYVTAIKDYKKIVLAYAVGTVTAILLILMMDRSGVALTKAVLIGIDIGFLVNLFILLITIRQTFNHMSSQVFLFTDTIVEYPKLFFINLFYTLGLYIHNFMFWSMSGISVRLMDTFIYAPSYDIATFLSVLTILPATVIFIVRVETNFYEQYRKISHAILHGGCLKDIDKAREEMVRVLKREINTILQIQFIVTVVLLVFGVNLFLPLIEADNQIIELYSILSIGYYMTYMAYIVVTILLYFDDQESAIRVTFLFLVMTIVFTGITLLLGERFYGLGLDVSAIITLIVSIGYLNRTISQVDYRLFSRQPVLRRSRDE